MSNHNTIKYHQIYNNNYKYENSVTHLKSKCLLYQKYQKIFYGHDYLILRNIYGIYISVSTTITLVTQLACFSWEDKMITCDIYK